MKPKAKRNIGIFFSAIGLATAVAYTNTLKKKRLSVVEAIFGILISTAAILVPRML